MTFIYRTFLIAVVTAIVWFSYVKHVESRDRMVRVQDLKDCFQRRDFAPSVSSENVQKGFMQALVRLSESLAAERQLGWWKSKEINLEWYIEEALKDLESNPTETSLIRRALQQAFYELQKHGQLAEPDQRENILRGKPAVSTQGNFIGDPLRIGYHLSPVIIPHLRNHPGNFVLQPATVWALQQDIIEPGNFGMIREFHAAGALPDDVLTALSNQYLPKPPPEREEEKND